MSNANTALVQQAAGIVASLGLLNASSVLVGTNNLGPSVSVGQIQTTLNNLVAAITALDP